MKDSILANIKAAMQNAEELGVAEYVDVMMQISVDALIRANSALVIAEQDAANDEAEG